MSKIKTLDKSQLNRLEEILADFLYCDWRFYRFFDRLAQKKYLFGCFENLAQHSFNRIIIFENEEKILGVCVLKRLDWDSKHFEVESAEIQYLMSCSSGQENIRIKKELLEFTLNICKEEKISFLSCKIDSADISSIYALEVAKFRLMDTQLTFSLERKKRTPNIKILYRIREFKREDLRQLSQLAQRSFPEGRFHADPYIPKEKADRLYVRWIEDCPRGIDTGKILVAERKVTLVGVIVFKLYKEIEDLTGYRIIGQRGLMLVAPEAKGVSLGLVKTSLENTDYDYAEYYSSITNREAIRISEKFNFNLLRSKYVFHYHIM